jgi:hypothetical protein
MHLVKLNDFHAAWAFRQVRLLAPFLHPLEYRPVADAEKAAYASEAQAFQVKLQGRAPSGLGLDIRFPLHGIMIFAVLAEISLPAARKAVFAVVIAVAFRAIHRRSLDVGLL